MNTTRLVLAGILLSLAAMTTLTAQTPDNLASLVSAERAFARMAADSGMKPAFLAFLDDEGIIFRPDAKNGKQVWREAPETRALLAWDPVWAEVSADGTLGYSTGPWTLRRTPEDTVAASGTFISVWKRDRKGEWKVMVDLGIGHEQIADTTERVATTSIVAIVPPNAQSHEVERARLHSLEIELSAAATSSGFGRAIKPLVAEDARFNRHGLPPVIGRREVEQLLTQEGGRRGWEVTGWDVAGSRDLAYAWGSYQTVATDGIESEKGNYLRVWRRNPEGKWEVALEVMSGVR